MRKAIVALTMSLLILGGGFLSTADAQERRGFWIGSAIGYGAAGTRFDARDFDGGAVSVVNISTGWTITPQLLLGVDINSFAVTFTRPGVSQPAAVVDLTAGLTYYPRATSGLFVKGGIGPSIANDTSSPVTIDVSGTGISGIVGAGYEFYLGRNFSLTTGLDFRFARIGDINFDQQSALPGWRHRALDVTVGIKFN
jgi:hypothetical protein